MKVRLSSSAATKARNTRLRFQKLTTSGTTTDRWKSLLKPVNFKDE